MKPERCGDTIEVDKMLEEMSVEELKTIKSLNEMCECEACRGAVKIVVRELTRRGLK